MMGARRYGNWQCIDCLEMPRGIYNTLSMVEYLKRFCPACEQKCEYKEKVAENKMEQLIQLMNKLLDNYGNIEQQLNKKAEQTDVVKIEEKMAELQLTVSSTERDGKYRSTQKEATAKLSELDHKIEEMA